MLALGKPGHGPTLNFARLLNFSAKHELVCSRRGRYLLYHWLLTSYSLTRLQNVHAGNIREEPLGLLVEVRHPPCEGYQEYLPYNMHLLRLSMKE